MNHEDHEVTKRDQYGQTPRPRVLRGFELGREVAIVAFAALLSSGLSSAVGHAQSATPATSTQAPRPAAPAGNAENGGKLFVKYGCYQCHGREGQGGAAGPRIAPNTPSATALIRYVRAPRGEMPPYTEKLLKSDQDLIDIHAYLSTRAAAKPQNIPLPQ